MSGPARRRGDDPADSPVDGAAPAASTEAQGGEAACWAHLVCPECGAMTSEGHQPGCSLAAPGRETTA